jgi:hypothetical protein
MLSSPAKADMTNGADLIDLPDGQISNVSCFSMSSPARKNISVFPNPNQIYIASHPVPHEGRWPSSRTLGRDAVDAAAPARMRRSQGGFP